RMDLVVEEALLAVHGRSDGPGREAFLRQSTALDIVSRQYDWMHPTPPRRIMRTTHVVLASLLAGTAAAPGSAQSIMDRIKKQIKVEHPGDSAKKAADKSTAKVDLPTSSSANPDMLGIKVGLTTVDS